MNDNLKSFNHIDLLFPGQYVKAADLRGRDVTVVIDDIDPRHELKGQRGTEHKPVVTMRGKEKLWILNKTNAKTIAKLHGTEVTAWLGKAVVLYPTKIQAGGETVDAIRVRERLVAAPDTEAEPPHDLDTGEVTDDDLPRWSDAGDGEERDW